MSKHYQLESNLSLTGSNADKRYRIKPSEQKMLLSDLYDSLLNQKKPSDLRLLDIANKLRNNMRKSIIICDSNDTETQLIVNNINNLLNNYDNTISLNHHLF
jgi:molybdopterin-containing oxidoreductase family iron-sulfur binding subunit